MHHRQVHKNNWNYKNLNPYVTVDRENQTSECLCLEDSTISDTEHFRQEKCVEFQELLPQEIPSDKWKLGIAYSTCQAEFFQLALLADQPAP